MTAGQWTRLEASLTLSRSRQEAEIPQDEHGTSSLPLFTGCQVAFWLNDQLGDLGRAIILSSFLPFLSVSPLSLEEAINPDRNAEMGILALGNNSCRHHAGAGARETTYPLRGTSVG